MKKIIRGLTLCCLSTVLFLEGTFTSFASSSELVSLSEENPLNDEVSNENYLEDEFQDDEIVIENDEASTDSSLDGSEEGIVVVEDAASLASSEESLEIEVEESDDSSFDESSSSDSIVNDKGEYDFSKDPSNKGAKKGACGENATWSYNGGKLTISGSGAMYDFTLEKKGTVDGVSGAPWDQYKSSITSLVISDSITHIGKASFVHIKINNTNFKLPSGLSSVGENAFYLSELGKGISKFVIPGSMKIIGPYAFSDLDGWLRAGTNLVLSEGIIEIGPHAFDSFSCSKITWPTTVEKIDESAFEFVGVVHDWVIPASVKSIGKRALYMAQRTATLTFDGDMPEIGQEAFGETSFIVYYDANNKTFSKEARDKATKEFGAVNWLPKGQALDHSAGENITWSYNASSATLSFKGSGEMYDYSLTNIPVWHIYFDQIGFVTFDNNITAIGDYALYDLGQIQNHNGKTVALALPKKMKRIGKYAFSDTYIVSCTLPDSIEIIDDYAFYRTNFKSSNGKFPKGVKYVGDCAFYDIHADLTVSFDAIEEIGTKAFYCNSQHLKGNFTFPDTLKKIGEYAFWDAEKMSGSLKLPKNVSIGKYAFQHCKGMTGSYTYTADNIANYEAFGGTALTELVFDSTVTKCTTPILKNLKSLSKLTFEGEFPEFSSSFFSSFEGTKCVIGFPIDSLSWGEGIKTLDVDSGKFTFDAVGTETTVTFMDPYGNKVSDVKVKKNQKITPPSLSLKQGDELNGWFTVSDNKKQIEKYKFDFNTPITSRIILYAGLKVNGYYRVIFYSNGGSEVEPQLVEEGKYADKPVDPKKPYYKFVGWFYDEALTKKHEFNYEEVTSDIELYAKWESHYPKVVFRFNDHYNERDELIQSLSFSMKKLDLSNATLNKYVKQFEDTGCYKFLGWYYVDGTKAQSGDEIAYDTNIVAKWDRKKVSVTVDYKDGKRKIVSQADYDERFYPPEYTPQRTGYKFVGWMVNDNGTEYKYSYYYNFIYNPITIFATWKKETPNPEPKDPVDDKKEITILVDGRNINTGYFSKTYTGKAITFGNIVVKEGSTVLEAKKHYTVSYSNNINVPSESNKAKGKNLPTCKITFKGGYKGTKSFTFNITPISLSDRKMSGSLKPGKEEIVLTANNKVQKGTTAITLTVNGKAKKLTLNKDYKFIYPGTNKKGVTGSECAEGLYDPNAFKAPGQYKIKVVGIGNYKDSIEISEYIKIPIGKYYVNKLTDEVYCGKNITKDIKVYSNKAMTEDCKLNGIVAEKFENLNSTSRLKYDYIYSFTSNLNKGKAKVTITGINRYNGKLSRTFNITAFDLSTLSGGVKSLGTDSTSPVKCDNNTPIVKGTCKPPVTVYAPKISSSPLVQGKDYTLVYSNNKKEGATGKVTITGKGNFKGKLVKEFIVGKKEQN